MTVDSQTLLSSLRSLSRSSFKDEDERATVLKEAQALCTRLESPFETLMRLTYQEPSYDFALRMALDVSLFHHLTKTGKTTKELAQATGTEAALLRRFLRHLGARGTIAERGPDLWAATELSDALTSPDAAAGVEFGVPYFTNIYHHGPAFFREAGYKNPRSGRHTLFNHALACPGQLHWEHMQEKPEQSRQNNMMLGYGARNHPSWLDVYLHDELFTKCEELQNPEAAAFVDVGGGVAVDVLRVRSQYPRSSLPARVVLQELEKVIDQAKTKAREGTADVRHVLEDEIEFQVYDFFTAQPVRGARVYFLSSIMHDWPEEDARKILGNIAAAMTKGFSKLLISDYVVPPTGVKPQVSGLDLVMMAVLGSGERTRETWDAMLASQGMRISRLHEMPTWSKSLLEIELVE